VSAAEESYAGDVAALARLRDRGWRPRCVYDVGASNGAWTHTAAEVFPLASYHLFEPLADECYRPYLDWLSQRRDLSIAVHPIALDNRDGDAVLGVSTDPVGSSLLVESPIDGFPSVERVSARTLDGYRRQHSLPAPDLLKLDTQGTELRILEGAEATLRRVQVVLVEAWLERGYGPGTPLMHELLAWLSERGLRAVEFTGEWCNSDGVPVTKDVLLVRPEVFQRRREATPSLPAAARR
jgi:FkbM family methyltransferase